MVSFWIYDVIFLILFSIWVVWFLNTREKGLSRDGWLFMYRTQVGVKFIKYVGDNYKRTLDALRYIIITVGFFLMGVMVWMLGKTVAIYIFHPEITKVIKAPPIAPLIPYFPKLFGMESFFPPFYFTYFILALAIVAIVHEFSHGIFMRRFGIKIKSTGIVFLGPLLGAFVEEEKKGFEKKSNLQQMTILGAGVFANLIFALIFYGLYVGFFFSSFAASGFLFNSYGIIQAPINSIENIGFDMGTKTVLFNGKMWELNLTEITFDGRSYLMDTNMKKFILDPEFENGKIFLIENSPALKTELRGVMVEADGVKINNHDDLRAFLKTKEPGDVVKFVTETDEEKTEYILELGKSPNNESKAYIGIAYSKPSPRGIVQTSLSKFMDFKESSTYYKPSWDGNFVYFIYNLLWWIMIINLLVALFNMMPLGMLDGGRFFYLAILSITRSEKFAKWAFKGATYAIAFIFFLMMFFWFIRII